MGFSGLSFGEILLVLVVLLVLFGSKKLPGIAADLGNAIRDFRRSMSGNAEPADQGTGQTGDPPQTPGVSAGGTKAQGTPETPPRERAP